MLPGSANAQAQLDGNDIQALTARTVLGIVSYAKWPIQPDAYRLCVVGDSANVQLLSEQSNEVGGRQLRVSNPVTESDRWPSECDVLYLGAMARHQRLSLLKKIQAETILTIGEGDEFCADGTMFCLDFVGQKAFLHANLDAIARSGIRVNANVLMLLRHKAPPP